MQKKITFALSVFSIRLLVVYSGFTSGDEDASDPSSEKSGTTLLFCCVLMGTSFVLLLEVTKELRVQMNIKNRTIEIFIMKVLELDIN